jgi:hypothetical protein
LHLVETVGARHELGDLVGRREQQAVPVRPLHHHVGERAERGPRPVPDDGPQPARRAEAGDAAVEALVHAFDRPALGRGKPAVENELVVIEGPC